MMLSNPKLMGATALAIVVAFGSGWFQRDMLTRGGVEDAAALEQTAEIATPVEQEEREMVAMPPARVVDSAGFPLVPGQTDADAEGAQASGPIVTVNGRPLGSDEPVVAATPTPGPTPPAEIAESEEQVAVLADPPRPIPRPEGLSVPTAQPVDYGAVTASISRPAVVEGFMSLEQRQALGPLPGIRDPQPGDRHDDLVAVVGTNGQIIWVYADQAGTVGQVAPMPTRPSTGNRFGFVYDDYDYRW